LAAMIWPWPLTMRVPGACAKPDAFPGSGRPSPTRPRS
jgi:hypothetical protein